MKVFSKQKYIYYCFNFINRFMVYLPVFVLFLKAKGLNQTHIMVMMSVYNIAILVGEIPTGVFADKISRKGSVVLGCIVQGVAMLCMIPSTNFYELILIEFFFGIGMTLQSGAMSAMFYDYLGSVGKIDLYADIEGKRWACVFVSQALASIMGGILAAHEINLTIFITGVAYIISAIVLVGFSEIPVKFKKEYNYVNHVVITFKHIISSKYTFALLIIIIFTEALFSTTMWLYQPYYQKIGISISLFGITYFVMNSVSALGGLLSGKIHFSYKKVIFVYMFGNLLFIGMMSIIHNSVGVIFPSCIFFVKGMLNPWIQSYWEEKISNNMRATASSILSLLSSLTFALIAIPVGYMSDSYSVFMAFGFSAIIYVIILCIFYFTRKLAKGV